MRHFSPQLEKRIVLIIGCVVIPLLLFVPLLAYGMDSYNVTGLLNRNDTGILFHVLAVLLLIWTDFLLFRIQKHQHISSKALIPLNLLILLALFIPYQEGKPLLNTVHITAAYAAFAFFTCYFIFLIHTSQKYLTIFLMTMIFCIFLCLTAEKVTGLSEVLFASITSILLTFSAI